MRERKYERLIPQQVFQQIAAKMPALVIGSGKVGQARSKASQLTTMLGESSLGVVDVDAALKATLEAAKPLPEEVAAQVDRGIRDSAAN